MGVAVVLIHMVASVFVLNPSHYRPLPGATASVEVTYLLLIVAQINRA